MKNSIESINQMIDREQDKIDAIAAVYTETPNEGLAQLHEASVQRINRLMQMLADAETARTLH
jgi:hypothetical protein